MERGANVEKVGKLYKNKYNPWCKVLKLKKLMQKWLQKVCNIYYIKCNELQRIALSCVKDSKKLKKEQ